MWDGFNKLRPSEDRIGEQVMQLSGSDNGERNQWVEDMKEYIERLSSDRVQYIVYLMEVDFVPLVQLVADIFYSLSLILWSRRGRTRAINGRCIPKWSLAL